MKPSRWKGLLASLILPGAGQFFQGRLKPAALAFANCAGAPPFLVLILFAPWVPPIVALLVLALNWIVSVYFLVDAWRPTPPLGWKRWLLIFAVFFALYEGEKHAFLSVCRFYSIPANVNSMSPTIQGGDHVFCCRGAYWFEPPRLGDIVVFPHADRAGESSIYEKRLVGLPGDILEFKDGALLVNGTPYRYPGQTVNYAPKPVDDSYFVSPNGPFKVPPGMIYVLGDNPQRSLDSRFFGTVPLSSVTGKITVIVWPVRRMQRITW
jgi:signal peptidase I